MLHRYCSQFLAYCQLADFSARSIQALTIRLIDFTADFNDPSIHVTKSRVWALRQFYHFLTLHRIIPENIATGIPYPKIYKTIPEFLTPHQYNRLIGHFSEDEDSSMGLRNLIIIMLHATTNQCFVERLTY